MSEITRENPPLAADEKTMLSAFLDYHRATLLLKVRGLSDADLRRSVVPSGWTLLGLVKHLAYVERWWFQVVFAGLDVELPWTEADPDADWRVEPDDSTEDILAFYQAEVAHAREITAAGNLDDESRHEKLKHTLRWILVHMIEETAQHNGHADIARELIDGKTGDA